MSQKIGYYKWMLNRHSSKFVFTIAGWFYELLVHRGWRHSSNLWRNKYERRNCFLDEILEKIRYSESKHFFQLETCGNSKYLQRLLSRKYAKGVFFVKWAPIFNAPSPLESCLQTILRQIPRTLGAEMLKTTTAKSAPIFD